MATVKDYKKEYKELYLPKENPVIVDVPEIRLVGVEGKGSPNDENGEFRDAIKVLYGIQYTLKMSKKGSHVPCGYFDYVVPPLEAFWWFDDGEDFRCKSKYNWLAAIRLPEFVNDETFEWACAEASKKKNIETRRAKRLTINEGLCVQCLHVGSYDDEPKTLKLMDDFMAVNNLKNDINETRRHHEIYLSNPGKTEAARLKTVLRVPVKIINEK